MNLDRVDEIVDQYGADPAASLAILQEVQQEYLYLPREAVERVAERLKVPLGEIYHLATFYRTFTFRPRGEYCVRVCMGTACHVHGASRVLEAFEREVGVTVGESTEDGVFSLEATSCLGACAQAPYVVVNDQPYPQMTPAGVSEVVGACRMPPERKQR